MWNGIRRAAYGEENLRSQDYKTTKANNGIQPKLKN